MSYKDKTLDDWNTNDLLKYMEDRHRELFNCEYQPFGSWQMERGMIGRAFGTTKRSGDYPKIVIKAFVDYCFNNFKPNAKYKGVSFGFIFTYQKNVLQVIEEKYNRKQADKKKVDQFSKKEDKKELASWFNS